MIDGYRTLKKDVTTQLLLYSNERKEPGWEQLKVNVVGAEGKKQRLSKEQTFLSFFFLVIFNFYVLSRLMFVPWLLLIKNVKLN